jgi:hypothetical protein
MHNKGAVMSKSKSKKLNDALAAAGHPQEAQSIDQSVRDAAIEAIPDGYVRQSTDVSGFWVPSLGAIHFIPESYRVFDSTIDPDKTSGLIIGRLSKAMQLVTADGVMSEGEVGDIVGIWAKPGMRDIGDLAGVPVYMYLDSFKDTGKASKMAVFAILSKTKGKQLQVSKDLRSKSKGRHDPLGILETSE